MAIGPATIETGYNTSATGGEHQRKVIKNPRTGYYYAVFKYDASYTRIYKSDDGTSWTYTGIQFSSRPVDREDITFWNDAGNSRIILLIGFKAYSSWYFNLTAYEITDADSDPSILWNSFVGSMTDDNIHNLQIQIDANGYIWAAWTDEWTNMGKQRNSLLATRTTSPYPTTEPSWETTVDVYGEDGSAEHSNGLQCDSGPYLRCELIPLPDTADIAVVLSYMDGSGPTYHLKGIPLYYSSGIQEYAVVDHAASGVHADLLHSSVESGGDVYIIYKFTSGSYGRIWDVSEGTSVAFGTVFSSTVDSLTLGADKSASPDLLYAFYAKNGTPGDVFYKTSVVGTPSWSSEETIDDDTESLDYLSASYQDWAGDGDIQLVYTRQTNNTVRFWATGAGGPPTVNVIESITVADVIAKTSSKLIPTDVFGLVTDFIHVCTKYIYGLEAITTLDSFVYNNAFYNVLTQAVTAGDYLSMLSTWYGNYSEAVTLTDYFIHVCTKYINTLESITVTDLFTRLWTVTSSQIESITLSDYYIDISTWYQRITEVLDIGTDLLTFAIGKLQSDVLALVDFIITDLTEGLLTQAMVEAITLLDYVYAGIFKNIIDTVTVSDSGPLHSISTYWYHIIDIQSELDYVSTWERIISESIVMFSDAIEQLSGALYQDIYQIVAVTDYLSRVVTSYRNLDLSLDITDYLSYASQWYNTLLESPIISDAMEFLRSISIVQAINTSSYIDYLSSWKLTTEPEFTYMGDERQFGRVYWPSPYNIGIGWGNVFCMCKFTAPEDGNINTINIYLKFNFPGDITGVVFDHNAGQNRPEALLSAGTDTYFPSGGNCTLPGLDYDMTKGEILWIGSYAANTHWSEASFGTTNQTRVFQQGTYPNVPTPYSPSLTYATDRETNVYATYTTGTESPSYFMGKPLPVTTLSMVDYLTYLSTTVRSFIESITIIDYLDALSSGALSELLTESINIGEYLSNLSQWYYRITQSGTLTHYLTHNIQPTLVQKLNLDRYLSMEWAFAFPIDTFTLLDFLGTDLTAGLLQEIMTEALAVVDYIVSGMFKNVIDTLTVSDTGPYHGITHYLDLSLDMVDYITYVSNWYRTGFEDLDIWSTLIAQLSGILSQSITEIISLADFLVFESTWYALLRDILEFNVPSPECDIFNNSFENNGFAGWTGTVGTPTVVEDPVHHGLYSMECDASGDYAHKSFSGELEVYLKLDFRIDALPGEDEETMLAQVRANGHLVQLDYVNWGGIYRFNLKRSIPGWSNNASSQIIIVVDTWYRVIIYAKIDASGTYTLWLDDVQIVNETGIDTTGNNIDEIYVGNIASGYAVTGHYDCVCVDDDTYPAIFTPLTFNIFKPVLNVITVATEFYMALQSVFIDTISVVDFLTYLETNVLNMLQALNIGDYLDSTSTWERLYYDALDITSLFSTIGASYRDQLENVILSEYITKTYDMSRIDTLNIVDLFQLLPAITLLQTLDISDYLTYVSEWYRVQFQNVTMFSTLIPQLSGALVKGIAEAITLLDYYTTSSSFYRSLIDTLTVVDYLFSIISLLMSESTVIATEFYMGMRKLVTDTLDITDILTYLEINVISLLQSLVMGDTITLSYAWYSIIEALTLFSDIDAQISGILTKILVEIVSLTDLLSYYSGVQLRSFAEILSTENVMSITWDIFKSKESLNITEYFDYYANFFRGWAESLSFIDYVSTFALGILQQLITQSLVLSDYTYKSIASYMIQPLTIIDYLITGAAEALFQLLVQPLVLSDYFTRAWTTFYPILLDVNITEYLSKAASTQFVQDLDLSYFLQYTSQFSRLPLETLALTDYYARNIQSYIVLPQGMTIIDYVVNSMSIIRIQGMTISDLLSKSVGASLINLLTITEEYSLRISPYWTQSITLIDYILPSYEGFFAQALYEIMSLTADMFKTVSLYRTVGFALSDYWDRQVDFTRVYTYDITLSGFLISAWSTSVEFVQGLIVSDPYLRVIFLTLLQMAESITILDSMSQMVPNVYKYLVLYMKDTTVDVFTRKMTATVYTRATAVALYIKRISQILYGKLRTSRR